MGAVEMDKYEKEQEKWQHDWKIYETSAKRIHDLNQSSAHEIDKEDKWMMTLAAGSFGLSFAFIDKIVPIQSAHHIPFLLAAWSCFLAILSIGLIGFIVSALGHTVLAEEESKALPFKYEGKKPEYKKRGIFFDPNIVLGYASNILFIGGSICLVS
jgi:hypothetical protein